MNYIYKVPLIPQNLNQQETIVQIGEALQHLSNVTDDILLRIDTRIDANTKKLNDITDRLSVVNGKIDRLSGTKRATQVFSSCKYPPAAVNQPYVSIFHNVKAPELVRHKVKLKKFTSNDDPLEKLHVYHVKVKGNDAYESYSGLGDIPKDVEFVNDLLLYNSGKNLYEKFVMSDALDGSRHIRKQENTEDTSIGAAPLSISERSTLSRHSTQNYFYTPNLGEVPALDVPLDLPDLPNIADLRYNVELDPGIAPSVIATLPIPDLPVIEETEPEEIVLPPPPPPILLKEEEKPLVVPLPPKPPLPDIKIQEEEPPPPKVEKVVQPDLRASLMESIRKAGGTKNLKATTKSEEKPSFSGGGDLMADLHAKLSMRRKGISGTKKEEHFLNATTAMEKISAMIPPPVDSQDKASEDEDWDD